MKLSVRAERASENTIKSLMAIGALYVDETGIHASEPGIYPRQRKIPMQTANPNGEKSRIRLLLCLF